MNFFKKVLAFIAGVFSAKATVATVVNQVAPNTTAAVTTTSTAPADVAIEDVQKAIDIVNGVKKALASPVAALITDLIPTTIDDNIRQTLVNDLPVVAAGLAFVKDVLSMDRSTALSQVLAAIRFSDKPNLDAFYHTLAAKVLQIISGGKVSWSQAVMAVEYVLKEAVLTGIDTSAGAAVMQNLNAPAASAAPAVAVAAPAPPAQQQAAESEAVNYP